MFVFIPFILALVIMLLIGAPLIRWLKFRPGMKWTPREDTPETHSLKTGVPSMGGLGIVSAAVLAWLLVQGGWVFVWPAPFRSVSSELAMTFFVLSLLPLITLGHCVLGYVDDLSKAQKRGGISSRQKLAGQIVMGALFLAALVFVVNPTGFFGLGISGFSTLISPLLGALLLLILVGTSNAVNLTDGIDGLAASLCFQVAASLSAAILIGDTSDTGVMVLLFLMPLGGACLGFLWFNRFPAKVFMGDTGSLALGAALGAGAIASGTVWLLPFIGFIFFVEMFSVILQVAYFKWTKKKTGEGKRLLRRAPIHHHFELVGWSERRVVAVFWSLNLFTSAIGLWLWSAGILPRFP